MPSADLSTLPTRSVAIGSGTGTSFVAWTEGQRVPMEIGGQGFAMLTPTIQLGDATQDELDVCYWVNLEPVTADGSMSADGIGWFQGGMVFKGSGDTRVAGPIFSPLESGASDTEVYYRLTVASEAFVGEQMIGVVTE